MVTKKKLTKKKRPTRKKTVAKKTNKVAKNILSASEFCKLIGINHDAVFRYIELEWLKPMSMGPKIKNIKHIKLDHEDMSRIRLIRELEHQMEINDHGISVVLHLLDQLHYLRNKLKSMQE